MSTSREAFLERVRQAVSAGNRAGKAAQREPRGSVGYQGAGPDAVARFSEELRAAGGLAYVVADREAGVAQALDLVQSKSARRVLVGRGPFFDTLGLPDRLRAMGVEAIDAPTQTSNDGRDAFFAADVGISGVDYLIAETGSIVLQARPGEPRSLSLLPPVHIVVAERSQVLADLFDLFESEIWGDPPHLSSCLSLITGPSKTGDIELRLVTGVHGPGEIHVVLILA